MIRHFVIFFVLFGSIAHASSYSLTQHLNGRPAEWVRDFYNVQCNICYSSASFRLSTDDNWNTAHLDYSLESDVMWASSDFLWLVTNSSVSLTLLDGIGGVLDDFYGSLALHPAEVGNNRQWKLGAASSTGDVLPFWDVFSEGGFQIYQRLFGNESSNFADFTAFDRAKSSYEFQLWKPPAQVPLPASGQALLGALCLVGLMARRRKRLKRATS